MVETQKEHLASIKRIFKFFKDTKAKVRPHFLISGATGTGKSQIISNIAKSMNLHYFKINASSLTKEGVSGNSLSKAMGPLREAQGNMSICFVDEFDKLFIKDSSTDGGVIGNMGVQDEFLDLLEAEYTSIFGTYGKFDKVRCDKTLFIFAGAFRGEKMSPMKFEQFGIRPEFMGRISMCINLRKLTKEELYGILEKSTLLHNYLLCSKDYERNDVLGILKGAIDELYDTNRYGARIVNTLIHEFFIKGPDFNVNAFKVNGEDETFSSMEVVC